MNKDKLLIYGANGFSARLILDELESRGIDFIAAGRNADSIGLVAEKYNKERRVFSLNDGGEIKENLRDVKYLLNCAGPFKFTFRQFIFACLQTGTHYLDITGEIPVLEYAMMKNEDAEKAGIIILPAVGFDVIPSDCLAKRLSEKLPDAVSLKLGFLNKGGKISRGTWLTTLEIGKSKGKIRRAGRLTDSEIGAKTISFEKNGFKFSGISIPWGDVATAYYSTGIPDIEVYLGVPHSFLPLNGIAGDLMRLSGIEIVNKALKLLVKQTITGPGKSIRDSARVYVWGRVENNSGQSYEECHRVMEGYNLTAKGAAEAISNLGKLNLPPGSYTPSKAFGSDFLNKFSLAKIF